MNAEAPIAKPFSPRLDILPAPQRELWPDLSQVPAEFVLYGGTALALHLGHRQSIDFDFFALSDIDPDHLLNTIPLLANAQVLQKAPNTLDVLVTLDPSIKLSFFGLPRLRRLRMPNRCDNGIQVASLLDLAGTKLSVVQQRSEVKDYIDVAALLDDGRIDLPSALSAARFIYGDRFNPQISLKALVYFGDGNLTELPERSREILTGSVQNVDVTRLPPLVADLA